jgi:transposase-like protein
MPERPPYVRQIAAELELLSHGATTSFGASSSGVPGSREPSGESRPPHLAFLADWDRNGDSVLERWNELLKGWKGGGKVRPAGVSEREIVLADGEGFSPDDVAMRYRLTATTVRKWRREAGVNEDTGTGESVVARAKRLRGEGVSVRRIASEVGTHPTQVQRWTRKAA